MADWANHRKAGADDAAAWQTFRRSINFKALTKR